MMIRVNVALVLAVLLAFIDGRQLSAQTVLRAQVGAQPIATETSTRVGDTIQATSSVLSAKAHIRARAVFGPMRVRSYDMEASVRGIAQRVQLEIEDSTATLAAQVGERTLERTVSLSAASPVLVYQNFVFSPLAPQLGRLPLAVGASTAVQVIIIETAAVSTWNVTRATDSTYVITAEGALRLEVEVSGDRLVRVSVPAQSLVVSSDR